MSKQQRYEGHAITVCFDASRCIHSGKCVQGLPDVFRPDVKGQWIYPDAADVTALAQLIATCPSGALRYERKEGDNEQAPEANSVTVEANGPLHIRADFTINGEGQDSPRATLCRCGASKNKPWCDGAHNEAGFNDAGEVPPFNPDEEPQAGKLDIKPLRNGPLYLVGPHTICDSSGKPARVCGKSAMCRCGASKSKPYCDGSHAAIGFSCE
ncbi:putative Fe-S cluster protein YjdI [Mariprofundus ferrinatatus]|uniref:Putative Fe-S cluster protein YjdI n=1 Tax=Mariprofundus ferrinatatus TaxID=1921087 RepID=A0A2K8L681_9PROT|nr:CDGSH iron-sulfur domain-containing protein [Mariprofundus ferrinatatus]ATX82612.1 putative Fe-S cluster protein YjdI [Mariprofundus ferrinatatus]